MKKIFWIFFFLIFVNPLGKVFADQDNGFPDPVLFRIGYMEGIGGTVGDKGALAGGFEYQFFQDVNQAVSVSFEEFIDRGADLANRPLTPLFINYRLYTGSEPLSGFYFSVGAGVAMPWGPWHGGGSLAWQGSVGFASSGGGFLEFRYVGRPKKTLVYNGIPFQLHNTFVGIETGATF
jgi:hypothetical protein